MGILRALRTLARIATSEKVADLVLSVPEKESKAKLEAVAREFMQSLPVFPGEKPDTWNHEARIRNAFSYARVWMEELNK